MDVEDTILIGSEPSLLDEEIDRLETAQANRELDRDEAIEAR